MDSAHDLLEKLTGQWILTGTMGETELRQTVECAWVLNETYVCMHFKSEVPSGNRTFGYEAIYYIGYNGEQGAYVMHLLDTTEVPLECAVGLAIRAGNKLPFRFNYGGTNFFNIFDYDPAVARWSFMQTYEEDGQTKTFAVKTMVRTSG